MTRVAFDARALERPALAERGIGRYVSGLLAGLREIGKGDEVVVLRDLARPPAPERISEGLEHLLLGRNVRRAKADVLHSPTIDLVSLLPGAPLVVTLHDLIPLKEPATYLQTGVKHRLRYAAVKRAKRVIVPSVAVALDAERLLALLPTQIVVVPEAPDPAFGRVADPRAELSRLDLPERFLLWVGGMDPPDPRKGLGPLVDAVAAGDGPPLVLAGRYSAEGAALARPGRVFLTDRVSDAELAALYCAADVLVFPSSEEGYGLPVVEALACGTPVVAYATTSLPEVVEGATGAQLVEPGDVPALLAAAERLTGVAAALPARSLADMARETWAVYEGAAR